MAHEYADDDPQASEYAGKDPPDDSDNDEGLYVETNANVTKLLTTRGSPDSNEPMNGDAYHISTLDTLEHAIQTLRMQKWVARAGSLRTESSPGSHFKVPRSALDRTHLFSLQVRVNI